MLEGLTRDELLAVQRGRAAFQADVGRVVRNIAERHFSAGEQLTWQLIRDIREEVLADLGLAARWPTDLFDELTTATAIPRLDGCPTEDDIGTLAWFGRPIAMVFCHAKPV